MSKEGMSTPRTGIISVILLIAAIASLILAEKSYTSTYYRYVDKEGTFCFTDSRQSIPEAYRKKATKITDEKEKADKTSNAAGLKEKEEDGLLPGNKQELSLKEKLKGAWMTIINSNFLGPGAAVVLFITLFIVIGKVGRSLGHQRISSVLRIALTFGALIFLFYSYSETMSNTFVSLKKEVLDIAKQTEQRNKKIEDAAADPLESGSPRK